MEGRASHSQAEWVTPAAPSLRIGLGRAIRAARLSAGMTQEDLASRAGLHSTYVSRLEGGLKSPTLDVLVAIAGALGLTAHQLIADAEMQEQASSA